MTPPQRQLRSDDPRLLLRDRYLVRFFIVRHIAGVGFFLWLGISALRPMPILGGVTLALGAAYAAFALWQGRRLLARYRNRQALIARKEQNS
jgi:membrane protein implicated in regulation of membrane protease activity